MPRWGIIQMINMTQDDYLYLLNCIRDDKMVNFYMSRKWRDFRTQILIRDHYECQHCADKGLVTTKRTLARDGYRPKLDINHKKPIRKYPHLAFDPSNLETLCVTCHNIADGKGNKRDPRNVAAEGVAERW